MLAGLDLRARGSSDIIDQLKRCTEMHTELSQTHFPLWRGSSDNGPKLGRCFEEFCSFKADDLKVARFIDIRIVAVHQLQNFAFGNDISRI